MSGTRSGKLAPAQGEAPYLCPATADQVGLLAALHVAAGGSHIAVAVRVPVSVLALADVALAAWATLVAAAVLVIKVQQAPAVLACRACRTVSDR